MHEKLGEKFNIVRWNKKLTEILLLHCVTCYKERCTIIAAESQSAYEKHTRKKAIELHNDIQKNTWKLPSDSTNLLNRSKCFFEHGNINNINEWFKNITTATDRANAKTKETASNIKKFFPCTKPIPRPKNRLISEFKKQLAEKAASIRNKLQQNIEYLLIGLKR